MSDADLPVFNFRPNWQEPMTERLSFLTDVLRAREGAEQRRSLRESPRRSLDLDCLLTGPERTFWDLFIDKYGGGEVVAPLYWEVVTLPSPLIAGVSNRVDFDPALREWVYHTGRFAILCGPKAFDFELVEIAAVDEYGVQFAAPVSSPWPKGTKMYPIRRAVIEDVGELIHSTAATATVSSRLRFNGVTEWLPAEDDAPVYNDLPVFLNEPNWVDNLGVQTERNLAIMDTDVGLTYQVDEIGRALLGQAHRWYLPGRENLAAMRDMIFRHRGRAGAFWLPTFKADFKLVNSPGAGATQIEVEKTGFAYTGGPRDGRDRIAIKHDAGTIIRRVTSVVAGSTSERERLNLDSALGLALSPGQVRRISFVDTGRFDTDEFEIVHYGGVDAMHEMNASFRTFKNSRTAPTPIHYPIPAGVESGTPCGLPSGQDDWIWQLVFEIQSTVGSSTPTRYLRKGSSASYYNGTSTIRDSANRYKGTRWDFDFDIVAAYPGSDWRLFLQFPFQGGASGKYGQLTIQHWSWSEPMILETTSGGEVFELQNLWPRNYYFPDTLP